MFVSDAAGEKGAFVKFKDELLNVGHELEMKERCKLTLNKVDLKLAR